jgi:hypothetical protein
MAGASQMMISATDFFVAFYASRAKLSSDASIFSQRENGLSDELIMPPPVVAGYAPHPGGGINNQKMAIAAAFLDADENELLLVLPMITQMDQVNGGCEPQPFGSVFDERKIRAFAERHDIKILDEPGPMRYAGDYETYFWQMYGIFETELFIGRESRREKFLKDFFNSLEPLVTRLPALQVIRRSVFESPVETVAVQFRVELDWQKHCAENLPKMAGPEEQRFVPFQGIMEKVKNALPGTKRIFAICDEAALPVKPAYLRDFCFVNYQIYLVFKSDFLSRAQMAALKPVNLSLLDFEMAMAAEVFVGTSRSTFSNLAALQKHFANPNAPARHLIPTPGEADSLGIPKKSEL